MSDDPEQVAIDARAARVVAYLERLTYPQGGAAGGPPARRVELRALGDVGQAVWVTTDPLDFVDGYYRPVLGLDVGSHDVGVKAGADGRWSYFRDGVAYPATGRALRRGPMTVRQMIAPFEDALVIVLITRPPGATLTQIAITVMPDDEDPRRSENRFKGSGAD